MYSPLLALMIVAAVACANLVLGYYLAMRLIIEPQRAAAVKGNAAERMRAEASAQSRAARQAGRDRGAENGESANAEASPRIEAIAALRDALLASRRGLLQLDERLHANRLNPSPELIAEATSLLRQTARRFMTGRDELVEQLPAEDDRTEPAAAACGEMLLAADTRTIRTSTTLAVLEAVEALESPYAAQERIIVEVARLVQSHGTLAERLDGALLAVAGEEQVLGELPREIVCPGGGRAGLLGLVEQVTRLAGTSGAKKHCLAVWDVDGTAALNEEFGPAVAERVLLALGALMDGLVEEGEIVRISGQRLASFLPLEIESGAAVAERVRQTLEASSILAEGEAVGLTVSASVVGWREEEPVEGLLERSAAAVAEAKHYGRNRTFIEENDYTTPVSPPQLAIEPVRIEAASLGA